MNRVESEASSFEVPKFAAPEERAGALDWHTRLTLFMVKKGIRHWKAGVPNAERILPPKFWGELPMKELPFVYDGRKHRIPKVDEDWPASTLDRRILLAMLGNRLLFPLRDRDERWNYPEEARETFQDLLPLGNYIARPYHHWDEMQSDEALTCLAFARMGAWRLRTYQPRPGDPDVGACWEHDLSWLERYEVRSGFERYGARLLFGPDREPVAIGRGGHWAFPGDTRWEHAKWAWRCSLLVGGTIADHLVGTHWIVGNLFTTVSRTRLPPTHWLRLLLKPFTWRTITINAGATETLCPEYGLLHRGSALTYEALVQAFADAAESVRYQPVPEMAEAAGVVPLRQRAPWWFDAVRLHEVYRNFVADFVERYAGSDAALRDDPGVAVFWRALHEEGGRLGLPEALTFENLVEVLAWFIWTATGLHEGVGNVLEYIVDPTFMGTKIRPGRDEADVQSSIQAMIVIALTGLEMPRLLDLGELERVFGADRRGRAAFAKLQSDLRALSAAIDADNARCGQPDGRTWPCDTFNPKHLESSIAI